MICVRLSTVLPFLTHQNQGTFIKQRSLAHNIFILQDLLKGYSRKNISKRCLVKIDLSKAYDSVDWYFLEDLLNAYYFPSRFIRWIMTSWSVKWDERIETRRPYISSTFCIDHGVSNSFTDSSCPAQGIQISSSLFSQISGLAVNLSKSHIYFGGIHLDERKRILDSLKIEEGFFPLKYLGLCLRPTKWKAEDYGLILKKVQNRLHSWSSRHLSFAGRSQLIHSVLLGIRTYWMSIFLLPQRVIQEIDRLCRNFLWGVKGCCSRVHLSSWDQDSLWLKWVANIYLKGQSFWSYNLQTDVSWYWRKLIKLRDHFSHDVLKASISKDKLNLTSLYMQLVHKEKVHYDKVVWCKLSLPKHRFILWQAILGHLLTRDNLIKCHIPLESCLCPVCELDRKSHDHLFFRCPFSQQVLNQVQSWLGQLIWPPNYSDWQKWMDGRPRGLLQKISVVLAASVYYIWSNRNWCIFESYSCTVSKLNSLILLGLKAKLLDIRSSKLKAGEKSMVDFIQLL
ncbi:uncharacterized protein LOC133795819 [Humulus lupulus]|uniref:uncharacterized protein LOC133795819 n=1 Tax=Humulus lupulus TaxID=3486 RepID=UPI002B40FACC|nr:uncharacterized protein LOC133795819 [Humulus lupulus]